MFFSWAIDDTKFMFSVINRHLHNGDVTGALWGLKSPATRLFVRQLVPNNTNKDIKAQHYWHFVKEIHRWPADPPQKGYSNAEAVFMWWHHPVGMGPQMISRGSLAYRSWRIQYWTKTLFIFTESFVTECPRSCLFNYFRCSRSRNCCLNDNVVWLIQCSRNMRMIF